MESLTVRMHLMNHQYYVRVSCVRRAHWNVTTVPVCVIYRYAVEAADVDGCSHPPHPLTPVRLRRVQQTVVSQSFRSMGRRCFKAKIRILCVSMMSSPSMDWSNTHAMATIILWVARPATAPAVNGAAQCQIAMPNVRCVEYQASHTWHNVRRK